MIKFDYNQKTGKAKLVCDPTLLGIISNHFSEKNPSAVFVNKSFKSRGLSKQIPERIRAVKQNGVFDIGLYELIQDYLISESYNEIEYTDSFRESISRGLGEVDIVETKYTLRDYQKDCVETCLASGWGTVLCATGGGKSLIQATILETWVKMNPKMKALVVVPGVGLVSQLLKDFADYGVTFSYSGWTGKMERQDTQVVIVNTEILRSKFDENLDLMNIDLLLRDEVHGNKKSNEITKVLSRIKTPNRFGFTGTLPEEKSDMWKILGTFGPIIYEKSSKELRDSKYLSDVTVRMIRLNHKYRASGYKNELQYIQSDDNRNGFIKKIVTKLDKNILILVNRLEHGDILSDMLNLPDRETYFVHGDIPVEERSEIIQKMEKQDNIICVAMASIFAVGVNINNLPYVMFVAGGKSFTRVVQSIGRGLRLHKNKMMLVIFDIFDNWKYSSAHADRRKLFYDGEQIPWKELDVNI